MSNNSSTSPHNQPSGALLETPLHYVRGLSKGFGNPGIVINENAQLGYLNLRGDANDPDFSDAIASVTGIQLPMMPHRCNGSEGRSIYWLGPSEWLLVLPGGQELSEEAELRKKLQGHYAITDVSGGFTQISLLGDAAKTVLQKASTYDFHPSVFSSGKCVQTTLAKATALVSKEFDGTFTLIIRRSFADYLTLWLLDASEEFGALFEPAPIAD